ncbi:hypothetical protein IV203_028494 [Nitzschia inconspicua]|uniref:Uncharacterized protein n=1 Tax=Nitzschia inconspicua TaxID=303405 RepID=A0A9K3LNN0_9STRA|nr:hypothetical protein IV203_028494 [Nitzschia inconspicua]
MKPPSVSRLASLAVLSLILLPLVSRVTALEVNTCVAFCAKTGIPNCVSFCRFFHRTPTENGPIILDRDNGNTNETDIIPDDVTNFGSTDSDISTEEATQSLQNDNEQITPRLELSDPPSLSLSPTITPSTPSDWTSNIPSVVPTIEPISRPPTRGPTPLPSTYVPSFIPTEIPRQPTSAPTPFSSPPTQAPTPLPSAEVPSSIPTKIPRQPTRAPTPLSRPPTPLPSSEVPSSIPTELRLPPTSAPTPLSRPPTRSPTPLPSTEVPSSIPTEIPLQPTSAPTPLSRPPTQAPTPSPSTEVPSSIPTELPLPPTIAPTPLSRPTTPSPTPLPSTEVPSSIPTEIPLQPTSAPTPLSRPPTQAPTPSPSTEVPTSIPTEIRTLPTSVPIQESAIVPDCRFERKVGYQCGDHTFVCNADQYFAALEVCNAQPVPPGGSLYDWKDIGRCENNESVLVTVTVDHNATTPTHGCWCQQMHRGVTTPTHELGSAFPENVLCPNGEYVSSYVCYFPTQGGSSFKVLQQGDENGSAVTEKCTGYQLRDSLPPVQRAVIRNPS